MHALCSALFVVILGFLYFVGMGIWLFIRYYVPLIKADQETRASFWRWFDTHFQSANGSDPQPVTEPEKSTNQKEN